MHLEDLAAQVEKEVEPVYRLLEARALKNHQRVLEAFHHAHISSFHLCAGSGYGYGDSGREALDKAYAYIFNAEDALVRGQIVSGTHAVALCLYGVLRPGDDLLYIQGNPYDTIEEIIGIRGTGNGTLKEIGVGYRSVPLLPNGELDFKSIAGAVNEKTRMVMLQRSRGYQIQAPLRLEQMGKIINLLHGLKPDIVVFVDNCYGEFVETIEPPAVGADLTAGSLIKNPGGGLAPSGGYVVGKREYVQMAANRWTSPGIGKDVGPAPEFQRLMVQGLFLAPHFVSEALKGAVFTSRLFEKLGFDVSPRFDEERTEIVQSITLGSPELLQAFCAGLQGASPVDAYLRPEPVQMPGYGDNVIMAAGTFIQGASLELTADAPVREPYTVFIQGGLSKEYVRIGALHAAKAVLEAGWQPRNGHYFVGFNSPDRC